MATKKIGRSAISGKFKSVSAAKRDKKHSVVETIKTGKKKK